MLIETAAKVSKYWQPISDLGYEQTIQCTCSKYQITYWKKRGTMRLNPPKGMQQKFLYSVDTEAKIIDVLLDLEAAYEKATFGQRKTTVLVVESKPTTLADEIANFNRIFGTK